MDVPAIGKAKGLFEIFVPGVFLLLNIVWVLYCIRPEIIKLHESLDKDVLIIIVLIVFGYLIGVMLYLGDADIPDKWSARLRENVASWSRFSKVNNEPYYKAVFPYFDGLESIIKSHFPQYAESFYTDCWKLREKNRSDNSQSKESFNNKYFFNYCKTLINAIDERSALENYSNESLIMYLAAMFYALVISIILLILVTIIMVLKAVYSNPSTLNYPLMTYIILLIFVTIIIILNAFYSDPSIWTYISQFNMTSLFDFLWENNIAVSVILIISYVIFLLILLWHYRYMRFKEVQTVFTATLINKKNLEVYLKE